MKINSYVSKRMLLYAAGMLGALAGIQNLQAVIIKNESNEILFIKKITFINPVTKKVFNQSDFSKDSIVERKPGEIWQKKYVSELTIATEGDTITKELLGLDDSTIAIVRGISSRKHKIRVRIYNRQPTKGGEAGTLRKKSSKKKLTESKPAEPTAAQEAAQVTEVAGS